MKIFWNLGFFQIPEIPNLRHEILRWSPECTNLAFNARDLIDLGHKLRRKDVVIMWLKCNCLRIELTNQRPVGSSCTCYDLFDRKEFRRNAFVLF